MVSQKRKVKFLFAFDARRSFILDKNTKFNGLKLGVRVGDDYQIGIGFYGMQEPLIQPALLDKQKYPDSKDTLIFNFDYTTFFYERIWYKTKRWELTTPLHFGIGSLKLDYLTDTIPQRKNIVKGAAFTTELSFVAQYKVFRWFAIGTGVGYRWFLVKDKRTKDALNAPVYIIQFKVLVGELFRMATKKEDNSEW
ncbi:MAG: hypothetical protein ACLGGV_06285 [Bacteroidia bacterium]